jgi:FkbM family methyltransferase
MSAPTALSGSPGPCAISWRHRLVARYYRAPEHPGKRRLLGWLKRLLAVRQVRVEVVPGVVMELDEADYVQREILFWGGYERATLRLFDRLIGDARGFLDIGGHHGQYTLRAARVLAARGGRAFAFEPTPANAAALLHNARLSALENIDVCTAALSDTAGILRMVQPHATNTGGSRLAVPGTGTPDGIGIHVAVRPFSDFLSLLRPEAFDLVKIDVEGHEARVLASLFASPAPRPRHIILEYTPVDFDYGLPEGLPAWLEGHGYTVRDVTGAPYSASQPIPEANLWAELQRG